MTPEVRKVEYELTRYIVRLVLFDVFTRGFVALSRYLSPNLLTYLLFLLSSPLCFLAGCHKRRLNQALSVLSLSLGF